MHIQWTTVAPNSQPHYWHIKSRIQTIATVSKRKESFILHILKFNRGCTTSKFKKFWFNHPSFYHHTTVLRPFLGPPGWAGARKELLDFMVQGKIYRGRRTDSPDGHHSIRTKQCPPPPSPIFLQAGCPSCHPTNSVKALKATSTFGLGRRRYSSPQRCYLHCLRTICTISAPFFRSPYRKGDIEARKRCRKEQQKFYQDWKIFLIVKDWKFARYQPHITDIY